MRAKGTEAGRVVAKEGSRSGTRQRHGARNSRSIEISIGRRVVSSAENQGSQAVAMLPVGLASMDGSARLEALEANEGGSGSE
jgi:hypothetical protein